MCSMSIGSGTPGVSGRASRSAASSEPSSTETGWRFSRPERLKCRFCMIRSSHGRMPYSFSSKLSLARKARR